MAGKRDLFEKTLFQNGNRALKLQEHDVGESMDRVNNSGDVLTEGIKDPTISSATRRFKNEEISNNMMHLSTTRMQENANNLGIYNQGLPNQPSMDSSVEDQNSQGHQQGLPARDQNQNISVRSVSQDLPGIVPPREISTFPPYGDVEVGGANYRRMAVCQETDDALCQRTKMRVYMKRF